MKKNKMAGFLWIAMLLIFANVRAQEKTPATPEENATRLTEWMKTNLQLTEKQVAPVQTINLKYATKMQELKSGSDSKMQKMRALKADSDAKDQELKRVLTSEQFQTWLVKKEEVKEKIKEKKKQSQ